MYKGGNLWYNKIRKQRKENMIKHHKDYNMFPLMLGGLVCVLSDVAKTTATATATAATAATAAVATAATAATAPLTVLGAGALLVDKALNDDDDKIYKHKYNRSMEELAAILQRNLANVRIIAGLNADYYAKSMQVTKQAISNLETGRVKMSTQLGVAWTTVIQILAHGFPNNIPLQKTCNLLLYKLDDYSDEEISKFEEIISKIAKAKKAGVDDETLELLASFLPDIKDK